MPPAALRPAPVAPIVAAWLRRRRRANAPLQARLARIRADAEHGARLTEQMLAYSGRSPVALKPIELSHLVEEMADLLRASVSERCRIEFELSLRTPVEEDATQIQQVVLNLASNADEALGDAGGVLRVRTGRTQQDAASLEGSAGSEDPAPGPYVFLEVSDDGTGTSHLAETTGCGDATRASAGGRTSTSPPVEGCAAALASANSGTRLQRP